MNDSKTMCLWTFPLTTQPICVKHIKNSWMTIWSVKISYPAECNCHPLYRMTSESYLTSSLPLLCLYISQCKFLMSCLIPRSSSTCTACTTAYYRFFNIWNKLLSVHTYICIFFIQTYPIFNNKEETWTPKSYRPIASLLTTFNFLKSVITDRL